MCSWNTAMRRPWSLVSVGQDPQYQRRFHLEPSPASSLTPWGLRPPEEYQPLHGTGGRKDTRVYMSHVKPLTLIDLLQPSIASHLQTILLPRPFNVHFWSFTTCKTGQWESLGTRLAISVTATCKVFTHQEHFQYLSSRHATAGHSQDYFYLFFYQQCTLQWPLIPTQPSHLIVEQYCAAWLDEILVHKGEDVHVVLWPHRGGDNGMVVINDLLQRADCHRSASQVIYLWSLLLDNNKGCSRLTNNYWGIPLRFRNTIAIAIGYDGNYYVQLQHSCQQPYQRFY